MSAMRPYEILVIFRTAGSEPELAAAVAAVQALVTKQGGTPQTAQAFGRRRLAYRIARQVEGYYYLFKFAAPSSAVVELERQLRLTEAIVRFIVLAVDDGTSAAPRAREASASAQAR